MLSLHPGCPGTTGNELVCSDDYQGLADGEIWSEILGILAERRKMVETDSRIAFRQSVAMSQEQAATLVAIIVTAAREFIADPADLQAFADTIEASTPGGVRALAREKNLKGE